MCEWFLDVLMGKGKTVLLTMSLSECSWYRQSRAQGNETPVTSGYQIQKLNAINLSKSVVFWCVISDRGLMGPFVRHKPLSDSASQIITKSIIKSMYHDRFVCTHTKTYL